MRRYFPAIDPVEAVRLEEGAEDMVEFIVVALVRAPFEFHRDDSTLPQPFERSAAGATS